MILTVVVLILLILCFMIWRRRNLSLFEILAVWLFVSTLSVNISDVLMANLELIKQTKTMQMFVSFFLNRTFLIPTLFVLFIDYYAAADSLVRKTVLSIALIAVMTTLEYAASWVKMIQFVKWHVWWSVWEWSCVLLCTLLCREFYCYLLAKGRKLE